MTVVVVGLCGQSGESPWYRLGDYAEGTPGVPRERWDPTFAFPTSSLPAAATDTGGGITCWLISSVNDAARVWGNAPVSTSASGGVSVENAKNVGGWDHGGILSRWFARAIELPLGRSPGHHAAPVAWVGTCADDPPVMAPRRGASIVPCVTPESVTVTWTSKEVSAAQAYVSAMETAWDAWSTAVVSLEAAVLNGNSTATYLTSANVARAAYLAALVEYVPLVRSATRVELNVMLA